MNSSKSVKDYIKDWWVENVSRHVNYRVLRQKLFNPIYFLVSYRGFIVLLITWGIFYWMGRQSVSIETANAINDYEVASTACGSRELRVRYDTILILQKDLYFKKLVYFCER